MTEVDDRPTIGERYGVAIGNGSTTMAVRGSSGDIVLAAAWQRQTLGVLLLRLLAEYDMVRGDLERAGHIAPRAIEHARELDRQSADAARQAARADDHFERCRLDAMAIEKKAAADAIRRRTPTEILSARTFILLELKTLRATREHVAALAWRMAHKAKVRPEVALKLSGRVLDVYLDPTCHTCDGTGRYGTSYRNETEQECRPCKGSGSRRDIIGNNASETTFAALVFGELQRQASAAARGMSAALGPDVDVRDDSAWPWLKARLEELVSVEAQED